MIDPSVIVAVPDEERERLDESVVEVELLLLGDSVSDGDTEGVSVAEPLADEASSETVGSAAGVSVDVCSLDKEKCPRVPGIDLDLEGVGSDVDGDTGSD